MKLSDLCLEDSRPATSDSSDSDTPSGTYAAARLSEDTKEEIAGYLASQDIPESLHPDEMHCTILYSRKPCPDYVAAGEYDEPIEATPTGFEIWPTRSEPPKNVLVLTLKCDGLTERHEELMAEHDATYDFPDYKPHVTFSYDFGDGDPDALPPYKGSVYFATEYQEDLNDLPS